MKQEPDGEPRPRLPLRFTQPAPQPRPLSAPPHGKGGFTLAGTKRMLPAPLGRAPPPPRPLAPLMRLRPTNLPFNGSAAPLAPRRPLVVGWGAPAFAGARPAARPGIAGAIGAVAEPAEPPPPLGAEAVQQITALLQEAGGTVPMGRISQVFMGVKRAQLEDHFDLAREDSQWRVSLTSSPAAKRPRLR